MMRRQSVLNEIEPVQLLGIFRLILAILLTIFYLADQRLWPLDPELSVPFQLFLSVYLLFLLATTLVWRSSDKHTPQIAAFFAAIDLFLLSSICAYTGGINSPLIYLILLSIIIHGVLMNLGYGIILVLTSLIIMFGFWLDENYILLSFKTTREILTDQQLIKIVAQSVIAVTALYVANSWSKRFKSSQALVLMQQHTLLEAAALHEAIVQQSEHGIIVVDQVRQVQLMNQLAQKMLGYDADQDNPLLSSVSPSLDERLKRWLFTGIKHNAPFILGSEKIHVLFTQIKTNHSFNIVIMLESNETMNQRAQQNKLAALGQLTAAIAHEIRNPLTAISQANQLLGEQIKQEQDHRKMKLIEMTNKNVSRANRIINDILDIARRHQPDMMQIEISGWLTQLIDEFKQLHPEPSVMLYLDCHTDVKTVIFDPSQLRQVILNLLNNAYIHGRQKNQALEIHLSIDTDGYYQWLDIRDNGEGIQATERERLFEPFFSSHHQGTGLGLYLARELCHANQAEIENIETLHGAHFRIVFANVHDVIDCVVLP